VDEEAGHAEVGVAATVVGFDRAGCEDVDLEGAGVGRSLDLGRGVVRPERHLPVPVDVQVFGLADLGLIPVWALALLRTAAIAGSSSVSVWAGRVSW
jgi:hypothetical protein